MLSKYCILRKAIAQYITIVLVEARLGDVTSS